MIKSELVQIVASRNPHLFQRDIEKLVDAIRDEIVEALADGGRVEIRGFGSFSVRKRAPRAGRNPQSGEALDVGEKWVPMFRAGKVLRDRLNGGG